jgi:predicted AlkP superfamily pyrophosphatase or phosphodiesterase
VLAAMAANVGFAPMVSRAENEQAPSRDRLRTVILVSLDGTRPVDFSPETMPWLEAESHRGLRAEKLIPVVPTNTFPNHVSLVTGVAPERHGIVNNSFIDPSRGRFRKRDIPSWIEVEPIWSLLARQGVPSASYHWVGSEGRWPSGGAPVHWEPFDSKIRAKAKVDRILEWLDLDDPCRRPQLITTWFHGADHAGHVEGPGSKRGARDLLAQDRALQRLWQGLVERGLADSTLLVVVSDHGMAAPERRIDAGAALRKAGIKASVLGIVGFASVYLDDPATGPRALSVLRETGLEAYSREAAPASLPVSHPRFGDLVVTAPGDAAIVYRRLSLAGYHGYPPTGPDMAAIFVVVGAGVPRGVRVPEVRAIDVAPTLLSLFGASIPPWIDGSPVAALGPLYAEATPASKFAKLAGCRNKSLLQ